jgi:hypothetical protein
MLVSHIRRFFSFFPYLRNVPFNISVLRSSIIRILRSKRRLFLSTSLRHQSRLLVKLRGDASKRKAFSLSHWHYWLWIYLFNFLHTLSALSSLQVDSLSKMALFSKT